MIFVDTNVWLRSVQPTHPLHQTAVDAIAALIDASELLVITTQIAAEFWNVATRPVSANGFGFTTEEARQQVTRLESFFSVLAESPEVYAEWKRLVVANSVQGVKVHDARIVAAMNVYGISRILTFNSADFARYAGLEVIEPT